MHGLEPELGRTAVEKENGAPIYHGLPMEKRLGVRSVRQNELFDSSPQ